MLAPIPGIVTNVDALQVGEYLPAAQAAFSLVSSADVWIEANPEGDPISPISSPARRPIVTIDTYPGREWQATVDQPQPGDRHRVLGAAGAERDRQLGEGGAARADPAAPCRCRPTRRRCAPA